MKARIPSFWKIAICLQIIQSSSSKKVTVKWTKDSTADGYQIKYSYKDSNGKTVTKYKTVSSASTLKATLKNLKKGKTYTIKIRSYKKTSSGKVYSSWSKAKKVKVK